jgi:hypothetical protein
MFFSAASFLIGKIGTNLNHPKYLEPYCTFIDWTIQRAHNTHVSCSLDCFDLPYTLA